MDKVGRHAMCYGLSLAEAPISTLEISGSKLQSV